MSELVYYFNPYTCMSRYSSSGDVIAYLVTIGTAADYVYARLDSDIGACMTYRYTTSSKGPVFNPQSRTASYQRRYKHGTSSALVKH